MIGAFGKSFGRTPPIMDPRQMGQSAPRKKSRFGLIGNNSGMAMNPLMLIGAGLKDLDGTMGSGNLDNALAARQQAQFQQQEMQKQAEAEEQRKRAMAALRLTPEQQALAEINPEGVTKALTERAIPSLGDDLAGRRFEHDVTKDARDYEYRLGRDSVLDDRDARDFDYRVYSDDRTHNFRVGEAARNQFNTDRGYERGAYESDRAYAAGRDDESYRRNNPSNGIEFQTPDGSVIRMGGRGGTAGADGRGFVGGAGSRPMQASDVEQLTKYREQAANASGVLAALNEAEALLNGPDGELGGGDDYSTGPYAGVTGQTSRFTGGLVGGRRKGANYERARALSKTLGMEGLKALSGSDTERELITSIQATFSPDKLPETNRKIIARQKAVMEIIGPFKSEFVSRWMAENGSTFATDAQGRTMDEALAMAQRQKAVSMGLLPSGGAKSDGAGRDLTATSDRDLLGSLGIE